jgi:hypothetical protein
MGGLLAAGLFYAVTAGAGLSDAEVRALGWLPLAVPADRAIGLPTPAMLSLVEWGTVAHAIPLMISFRSPDCKPATRAR